MLPIDVPLTQPCMRPAANVGRDGSFVCEGSRGEWVLCAKLVHAAAVFLFLVIWPVATSALPSGQASEVYSHRVWQAQDGLPYAIQALAQTKDGYLWIGTSGGLLRFDGLHFASFGSEDTPGLHDDSVWALLGSRDGSLWIGTEGSGLLQYCDGKFISFGSKDGLTNRFIRAIYEDGEGALWVGTDAGVFRRVRGVFSRVDRQPNITPMNVYTIRGDKNGRVLVGGSGLLKWDNGKVTQYQSHEEPDDRMVGATQVARDGSLWVGTFAHLRRSDALSSGNPLSTKWLARIPTNDTIVQSGNAQPTKIHVSEMTETRDGKLWIGTYGEGLLLYDKGRVRRFREPFLPDDNVQALFEDSEANLWVGTQNGLVRINSSMVTTVRTVDGNPINISTIYAAPDGKLWMTSLGGQLFQLSGQSLTPAELPVSLAGISVRNVFTDSGGILWIGSAGQGITQIRTGRGRARVRRFPGALPDFIRAFCEGLNGDIWVGTDAGLRRIYKGRYESQGEVNEGIRTVVADRNFDIWVGTDQGVFHLRDNRVLSEPRLDVLRHEKVWAIYEDSQGHILLGTQRAGMFILLENGLRRITMSNGIPSNSIFSILEDKLGNLWISSAKGVFSIRASDLLCMLADPTYRLPLRLYSTSEGFAASHVNGGVQPAGAVDGNGNIWFPSSGGAVRIQPGMSDVQAFLPIAVEEVLADGHQNRFSGRLDLLPGTRHFEIHYTAMELRSPERVRFRYRLKGFDDRWVDADDRRVAYYTNVPAGNYQFQLLAYDVSMAGKPSQINVPVRVHPHFYRTGWFFGLCALLAVWLAAFAYLYRVRQVREHFNAVLQERTRLAREMHDTLIQGCVGVSTLLEAASSMQDTSPGVSHELVKQARTQVRLTMDEARRAVWKLREQSATLEGISASLAQMANNVTAETAIKVDFRSEAARGPISPEIGHNVLLVVREAVSNAVRHGKPKQVSVDLSLSRDLLSVSICDDGCGFTQAPDGQHYGILGMRERVRAMGGELKIASCPEAGTKIRLTIPCTRNGFKAKRGTDDGPLPGGKA